MINQIIIIGGHIQALGLARQTAKLGIPVILFIEDGCSVARYSKSVYKTEVFGTTVRLALCLKQYEDTDTMLFPTADDYVDYLAVHYNELSKHFYVAIPDPEIVALFGDKRKTYKFAEQTGIPHPKSWYPEMLTDIASISDQLTYPIVVKPAVMYSFHKLFGKKAFRCDTKDELIRKCEEINEKIPISAILIQEFLAGGAKALYSYGVFAVDGEPKAWITANRIRQNPMDFGNSTTFALSCNIPEIEKSARTILRQIKYTGLAEVEYMYDERTGTYKFLEINTRAWKWHSISMGLGFGFLSEWIHYLNGEEGVFCHKYASIAWVERLTDFTIIMKEKLKGHIKLSAAVKSYRRKKVSAVWSLHDPLPAVMYLLLSPFLYIKRY